MNIIKKSTELTKSPMFAILSCLLCILAGYSIKSSLIEIFASVMGIINVWPVSYTHLSRTFFLHISHFIYSSMYFFRGSIVKILSSVKNSSFACGIASSIPATVLFFIAPRNSVVLSLSKMSAPQMCIRDSAFLYQQLDDGILQIIDILKLIDMQICEATLPFRAYLLIAL